jgi:hypothetical protein
MSETTTNLAALEEALAGCRRQHAAVIENADRILEARRTEHYQRIDKSARRVAGLESELELYDALEQERRAARVRTELAGAIEAHKGEVDGANNALAFAIENHVKALTAAGVAAEASFNAAVSAAGGPKS